MTWLETASETFVARYDVRDADDAERVLAQLEYARERLQRKLDVQLGDLAVVLHPTSAQLDAAQPWLPLQRARTAPAARRYVVGTVTEEEIHVLAPRVLAQRASNVEGSLELLMLAPSALLAKRMLAVKRRPWRRQDAPWRLEGAAQFFSGQIKHIRPAVVLRIHERPAPSFPPGRRDALLLGGTVFDLLQREEGDEACLELARAPDPQQALERAFHGRPFRQTEQPRRPHLNRLARPGKSSSGQWPCLAMYSRAASSRVRSSSPAAPKRTSTFSSSTASPAPTHIAKPSHFVEPSATASTTKPATTSAAGRT